MRASSVVLKIALLCVLVAAPRAAAASDTPSVELTWTGPGPEVTCLGGERLVKLVNAYLGRAAITSPPGERAIAVLVERRAEGWRALIQLRDQREGLVLGERELATKGPLCSGLDEPLQIAVALLVDSELAQPPEPAPTQVQAPLPTPPPEPEAAVEPSDETAADPSAVSEPWRFALLGSLLLERGLLPAWGAGLSLSFEAAPTSWLGLRLHAAGFLPQRRELTTEAATTASTFYGGLAVCPKSALTAQLTLVGCLGVHAGQVLVALDGFSTGHSGRRLLLMGSLAPQLELKLGSSFALLAEARGSFTARQQRFSFELDGNRQELFSISPVVWSLGVGGVFLF